MQAIKHRKYGALRVLGRETVLEEPNLLLRDLVHLTTCLNKVQHYFVVCSVFLTTFISRFLPKG